MSVKEQFIAQNIEILSLSLQKMLKDGLNVTIVLVGATSPALDWKQMYLKMKSSFVGFVEILILSIVF